MRQRATGLVAATGRTSLGLGTAATTDSSAYLAVGGTAVSSSALKSAATTGLMNITGPAAGTTRVKTIRDVNDTLLEQSGSYTPTGTWVWTSATATWPTFNQDTTGLTNSNVPNPDVIFGSGSQTAGKRSYAVCTGACTITMPKPEPGNQIFIRNAPGVSTAITLAGTTGMYYEKPDHTGFGTSGGKLISGGDVTDVICLLGFDSTHYLITSYTGTWTNTP